MIRDAILGPRPLDRGGCEANSSLYLCRRRSERLTKLAAMVGIREMASYSAISVNECGRVPFAFYERHWPATRLHRANRFTAILVETWSEMSFMNIRANLASFTEPIARL